MSDSNFQNESLLQSFPTESGSDVYEHGGIIAPETALSRHGQEKWINDKADGNFSLDPLVVLLREQWSEIENLKAIKNDLTETNARLRNDVDGKSEQLFDAHQRIRKLCIESSGLREKLKHLAGADQKVLKLTLENSQLKQKVSDLEKVVEEKHNESQSSTSFSHHQNAIKLQRSILPKKIRYNEIGSSN